MTQVRAARPTLATVISIYEIILFAIAVFGYVSMLVLRAAHPELIHATLLQTAGTPLSALLSLAGGVLLWQMRSTAATLLGLKAVLGVIMFVVMLTQPALAAMPTARTIGLVTGVLSIILNVAIAWYAYKVTSVTLTPAV